MKLDLQLFIAFWVWPAVLFYRARKKIRHTVMFSCTAGAYTSRCYMHTAEVCTHLLSCYCQELWAIELLQIKKLKLFRPLNKISVRSLMMQYFEFLTCK